MYGVTSRRQQHKRYAVYDTADHIASGKVQRLVDSTGTHVNRYFIWLPYDATCSTVVGCLIHVFFFFFSEPFLYGTGE